MIENNQERNKESFDKPSTLSLDIFGRFEVAYRKNTADEDVIEHSFDKDIFFTGVPEYQPQEGHVIIDVGAHIGTFSLLASSKVGNSGKVYAIEASKDTFNLLKLNASLNKCDNINVYNIALSDKEGSCTLYHDVGNWGHSTVKKLSDSIETVNCSSLSYFLEKNKITKCNFIKMNCEGSEFPILLNTPSNILYKIDNILVLYHCDLWNNHTENDLISHLNSNGFDCVIRNRTENRGWIIGQKKNKTQA